jgi:hypothetical protein
MPAFDPSQLSFTAAACGYRLTYRGQPIGGAGLAHRDRIHWRYAHANREMFTSDARRDIEHLKRGAGQPRYLEVIRKIDTQLETTR